MQTRVKCINGIGNVYFPARWKTSVKLNVFKSSAIEKILSLKPERTGVTPASHLYLPSAKFWTITPACGNTGDTKWRTCQWTVRIALTPKFMSTRSPMRKTFAFANGRDLSRKSKPQYILPILPSRSRNLSLQQKRNKINANHIAALQIELCVYGQKLYPKNFLFAPGMGREMEM